LSYFSMPQWSPDAQQILFHATVGGQLRDFLVRATGGVPSLLSGPLSGWSRGGRWIYYSSTQGGGGQLWKKPAAGGEPMQVTQKGGFFFLCESPDGKFAYCWKPTSPPSLWRVPVDGGEETEVLHAIDHPSNVCVAGQGIYFVPVRDPASGGYSIQFLRLATGKLEPVAAIDKDSALGLTVSPDGRWLLYSQVDQTSCDLMLVENFR
jgi:Tol biopolymer transport system component